MVSTFPLWIGIAVAFAYLPMSDNAPSWPRTWVKTVPLLAFALAAGVAGGPVLLIVALLFAAVGDFALSRSGEPAFLAGLGAFAVMQVLYIILFLSMSGGPLWAGVTSQPVLALFLVAVTASTELWLTPHVETGLRWPVRVYALVITGMGLAALTLPLGTLTLGAFYFIASDILLALQLFRMSADNPLFGRTGWLIWVLYVAGQALILAASAG